MGKKSISAAVKCVLAVCSIAVMMFFGDEAAVSGNLILLQPANNSSVSDLVSFVVSGDGAAECTIELRDWKCAFVASLYTGTVGGLTGFQWDSKTVDDGKYNIFLCSGGMVWASATIFVDNVNDPPVFEPNNRIAMVGERLWFTVEAYDKDTAKKPIGGLTYTLISASPEIAGAYSDTDRSFSWSPAAADLGNTYSLCIKVNDDVAEVIRTIQIYVTANLSPKTEIYNDVYAYDVHRIEGNTIAYTSVSAPTSGEGSYGTIYLYYMDRGQALKVSTTKTQKRGLDISWPRAAWVEQTGSGVISVYDADANIITPFNASILANWAGLTISGSKVIWGSMDYGIQGHLLHVTDFSNITAPQDSVINTSPSIKSYISASNNKAAWVDFRNLDTEVYIQDISAPGSAETKLTAHNSDKKYLRMSGDRIVWLDNFDSINLNGINNVRLYDLAAGLEKNITNGTSDLDQPYISNDKIVWVDKIKKRICLYDIAQEAEAVIASALPGENVLLQLPCVDGDTVVWQELKNNKRYTYMRRLACIPSIAAITPLDVVPGVTQVTITGLNFGFGDAAAIQVVFNDNKVVPIGDMISVSNTQIVCRVPADAIAGPVSVINSVGVSNKIDVSIALPPNRKPVITSNIPAERVDQGALLTFTVTATDPDNDPITYSISGLPVEARIDQDTGVFEWTPGSSDGGQCRAVFTAFDGKEQSDPYYVSINVNRKPVFVDIPAAQTAYFNIPLAFTVTASDPDNDVLTYSVSVNSAEGRGAVTNASVNASTGEFTWTPIYGQYGRYNAVFTASDGIATATQTMIITIEGPVLVRAIVKGPKQIDVQWAENISNETGFQIFRRKSGDVNFEALAMAPANSTLFSDLSADPNTMYHYKVAAQIPGIGNAFPSSGPQFLSAKTPMLGPILIDARAESPKKIKISWTDTTTNERYFRVLRREPSGASYFRTIAILTANTTVFYDRTVLPQRTYDYTVSAIIPGVGELYPNYGPLFLSATTPAILYPTAPVNLRFTISYESRISARVTLSWDDISNNETGFKVYRRVGAGPEMCIKTLGANIKTWTDGPLPRNNTYTYRVSAFIEEQGESFCSTRVIVIVR